MPPRRQKKPAAQQSSTSMELPESVWSQVARYMTLAEWGKASGTCRTTFRTKLCMVKIPPVLSQSGGCSQILSLKKWCRAPYHPFSPHTIPFGCWCFPACELSRRAIQKELNSESTPLWPVHFRCTVGQQEAELCICLAPARN